MSDQEELWFVCNNCMGEYSPKDLGLFISDEDNKLAHFCPYCGFWEFTPSDEHDWEDETFKNILGNGPERYYEYPSVIFREPRNEGMVKLHKKNMENQGKVKPDLPKFSEIIT
ncbi:MAG: hypothetical protein R6U96_18665 [Promethearchaeia archaeon]